MKIQDEIDQLTAQLDRLKAMRDSCGHSFTPVVKEYENRREPIWSNKPMGSDYFNPIITGHTDVSVPVWRRTCTKCGLVQTTEKLVEVPVQPQFQPEFDKP